MKISDIGLDCLGLEMDMNGHGGKDSHRTCNTHQSSPMWLGDEVWESHTPVEGMTGFGWVDQGCLLRTHCGQQKWRIQKAMAGLLQGG